MVFDWLGTHSRQNVVSILIVIDLKLKKLSKVELLTKSRSVFGYKLIFKKNVLFGSGQSL